MAIKIIEGTMNVVEAARQRVQNAFDSGMDIVLSMSGKGQHLHGFDSL